MKLNDILIETQDDDQQLLRIADIIADEVIKHHRHLVKEKAIRKEKGSYVDDDDTGEDYDTNDDTDGYYSTGKIGELVNPKILSRLYTRLRHINIGLFYHKYLNNTQTTGAASILDSTSRVAVIKLYYNQIVKRKGTIKQNLKNSLVHELRHALDTSLSKGVADLSGPHKRTTGDNPQYNDTDPEYAEYIRSSYEINARALEAMDALENLIPKYQISTIDELKSLVISCLEDHDLIDVFDTRSTNDIPYYNKYFRRLFNRVFNHGKSLLSQ